MPLYDFSCQECGLVTERFYKATDKRPERVYCLCGSYSAWRIFGAPIVTSTSNVANPFPRLEPNLLPGSVKKRDQRIYKEWKTSGRIRLDHEGTPAVYVESREDRRRVMKTLGLICKGE